MAKRELCPDCEVVLEDDDDGMLTCPECGYLMEEDGIRELNVKLSYKGLAYCAEEDDDEEIEDDHFGTNDTEVFGSNHRDYVDAIAQTIGRGDDTIADYFAGAFS